MAHSSSSAFEWLASFTNHERTGVPDAAGTDTDAGFDLVGPRTLCGFYNASLPLFNLIYLL